MLASDQEKTAAVMHRRKHIAIVLKMIAHVAHNNGFFGFFVCAIDPNFRDANVRIRCSIPCGNSGIK